jgi:hypothetical protein
MKLQISSYATSCYCDPKRSLGILLKKRKERERGKMSHSEIKRDLASPSCPQILQIF